MDAPPDLGVWASLLACLAIIGFGGIKLAVYGDTIADKTGLGGGWVGFMLMAPVASLPELVSGVSAVTIAASPDIAVGNVLGSCIFNLVVLFLLDVSCRRQSWHLEAAQGHILTAGLTLVMFGVMGFSVLLALLGHAPAFGRVGAYTPLIVLGYGLSIRLVYRYEQRSVQAYSEHEPDRYPGVSLSGIIARYVAAALVVVAGSLWLPFIAKDLAASMGWRESFVGTLFVAFITCVPELVLSLAALRLGELDMAVGSLFGSNLFNILILAIDDLAYRDAPLLYGVSPVHLFSLFTVMAMTAIAIVGILYRPRYRLFDRLGPGSVCLLAAYVVNSWAIYAYGPESLEVGQAPRDRGLPPVHAENPRPEAAIGSVLRAGD